MRKRIGDEEQKCRRIEWIIEEAAPCGADTLNVGCSNGLLALRLAQMGKLTTGLDACPEIIRGAQRLLNGSDPVPDGISFVCGDWDQIDNGRTYDVIAMDYVLQHQPDPDEFLSKAERFLALGGKLILTVPWGSDPHGVAKSTFYVGTVYELAARRFTISNMVLQDGWIGVTAALRQVGKEEFVPDISLYRDEEDLMLKAETFRAEEIMKERIHTGRMEWERSILEENYESLRFENEAIKSQIRKRQLSFASRIRRLPQWLRGRIKQTLAFAIRRVYRLLSPFPAIRSTLSRLNGRLSLIRNPSALMNPGRKRSAVTKNQTTKLNVAMIADEFTYNSFRYECRIFLLEPETWKQTFKRNRIDLFFCESAWAGANTKRRPWRGKIYASVNFKHENRTTLLKILRYCKKNKIPTAFWNKEDPTHYEDRVHDFVKTALNFDHIFTTARECVERYRKDYGHPSVHLLMFATQPRLFNPIEMGERTGEIRFAGGWYRQHPDRCREMEQILDRLLDEGYPLVIYDRYSGDTDPNHRFPEKYRPYLRDSLKHDQLAEAYKGSSRALNINTVTQSDTMFARRVFELMSCNTLVVSNYSKGMEELFGGNVVFVQPGKPLDFQDETFKKESCLYEVLRYHTYAARLRQVCETVGIPEGEGEATVMVFYLVKGSWMAESAARHFHQLDWGAKRACLLVDAGCDAKTLRSIVVEYQGEEMQVISVDYCRRYRRTPPIECDYWIWADEDMPADLIARAMLHVSYLNMAAGVAPGNRKYLFDRRSVGRYILYPAAMRDVFDRAVIGGKFTETLVYGI